MAKKSQTLNPWTAHDEQGHASKILEWWATEAFFTSKENQKRWSLKVALSEGFVDNKQRGVVCNFTLFDQDTNTHYVYYVRTPGGRLQTNNETFDIRYNKTYMRGAYPTYQMHFHDPDHEIEIDFTSHAESFPHWVAQEATQGWLPMGIGFYRYGFIPKMRISGTMKIQNQTVTIQGNGFFEHVWGSFDYEHPLSTSLGFFKTLWVYKKLLFWWLRDPPLKIPRTVTFATENNPLGYDWVWALFDNGWSLFYGNVMFCLMDGPATGILIFSKDGKTFTEFSNIRFQYNKIIYAKEHDFCYPSELTLLAKKGKETLRLTCTMTNDSREYVRSSQAHRFWTGLALCEAPGEVKGTYDDGTHSIPLSGICKIEPQRELSVLGHNQLKIDFVLPPEGVGISFNLESHFFKKKFSVLLQLAPRPRIRMNMQRISGISLQ
jgi:hypothetical protein